MIQQHLAAVNVVVQVVGEPRRNTDELVDFRVRILFESREPQYYHVIIPKLPKQCVYKALGKEVEFGRFAPFVQDKVWLHVVGTSSLHHRIIGGVDNLQEVRERPQDYAICEVHLVAQEIEVVNGGI
ncbi:MAG: hypothetical protein A3D99_03380 [Candidatus Andersenbacteria bacterium RIFCSPHIGHO2_12_FULL_45_11]|uniref:Uncharacterized protein n=1 Tax=Candidatus Andersenbacteria bacterium RIFCSPHIGHO2_12_FULL_45_11 TaxID=1797281 RepID=A0A1G1X4K5_9BACT|nr:MAG: hypothetical protein A3D99_03380 [Candidatus Andersenbacteria bacterium RIFCSPHIGHO2_12_FULL_45_11]